MGDENTIEVPASKLSDMKGEVQQEIKQLEKHLDEMDQMKNESINKIEAKKNELKRLSEIAAVREEHSRVIEELITAKADIDERRLSIAFMDQTMANLDEQIGAIQAEHDRIAGEIEIKKNRLLEKIRFYEELNKQIEKLVDLLKNEELLFKNKLDDLLKQKEGLMNNPDLSPELLEQALKELDLAIEKLQLEHEAVQNQLKIKLSFDMDDIMRQQVIAEIDAKMETVEGVTTVGYKHKVRGKLSAEPLYHDRKEYELAAGEQDMEVLGEYDELDEYFLRKALTDEEFRSKLKYLISQTTKTGHVLVPASVY